jgi:RNA polymerase sigma-70 factor (ECF subfamily)
MIDIFILPIRIWGSIYYLKELIYSLIYLPLTAIKWRSDNKATSVPDVLSTEQINKQAERLMTVYGNNILRLAYSYLHNMSDAEDVLQDTLIQFIKAQPQFELADHEKAWVFRVAINISKNKITYNKIRKTDELSETLVASETEDLAFVWEAVKQLPLKYGEVVHLFYHEGYSTAQIASLLSKKEATIRSLLLRARMKLKDILKEEYDFGE